MNIHEIYNSFSISHNEILQKELLYFKTDNAHAESKRYNKKFQLALHLLKRIFIL